MKVEGDALDRILDVAAAAYKLDAELACPAPDMVMRRIYRERLGEATAALTGDERKFLRARGPA